MAASEGHDSETDPFHPPAIPTEVHCLHCGREYQSYLIEWVERPDIGGPEGFWACPTPGCDGQGFGFDILPTDPDYVSEDGESGWFLDDEAEDDGDYDDLDDLDDLEEMVDLGDLDGVDALDAGTADDPESERPGPTGGDALDEEDLPW